MVASGGAARVSNAYPVSRVADVLVGYTTVVAGSAAARVVVEVVTAVASKIAATARARRSLRDGATTAHHASVLSLGSAR